TEPEEDAGGRSTGGLGARRTAALAIGTAALAALGAGLAFELSSRSTYDESKREPNDARQRSLYDSADRKHILAQGLAIGGLACAAGAAGLWFTGRHHEEQRGVSVSPVARSDGFAVSVVGRV